MQIKIANTSFNAEAIKKMGFKGFEKVYKSILKGQDLKAVYDQIVAKEDKKPAEISADVG